MLSSRIFSVFCYYLFYLSPLNVVRVFLSAVLHLYEK